MNWEPMTVDELADYQQACGVRVLKRKDTWWIEPRPFFFRTLFPLEEIYPETANYPAQHLVGGVLHRVSTDSQANTSMKMFLYDELPEYSLYTLAAKQKWVVKKSLENFTVRRMTDLQEFIASAFPIYGSFYDRTRYSYKKERSHKATFAQWAALLFARRKIMVLGAFHEGKLAAVDISYQVRDLIIDDVFFSDTPSQSLRVTDCMVHTLREMAASSGARYLFRGFPCGKQTLDESKIHRGCKIYQIPAYRKINPVALYVGKLFMNESYRKLITITSASYLDGHQTTSLGALDVGAGQGR
jgi:hypothetical protein